MKPPVFLDTGAIFALADADSRANSVVRMIYLDPKRRFILHDWILAEAFSLLTKRLHKQAALHLISALRSSPKIEVVPVGQDLLDSGWARCRRFLDKEWDWVDCVSFELMERRGIREALSLDRHFAQAGFLLLAQ